MINSRSNKKSLLQLFKPWDFYQFETFPVGEKIFAASEKSVNPWIWDDLEKSPQHAFRRAQQWNNLGLCDALTWFFHDSISISTLLPAQSNGGGKEGGKGHTLCLIQSINPPKSVSNPRDTGNILYSHISTQTHFPEDPPQLAGSVTPVSAGLLAPDRIITLPVVSETKHLFLPPPQSRVFKEVQFQVFQHGSCPQFDLQCSIVQNWSEGDWDG